MKTIQSILDKIPHWVFIGLMLFVGASYKYIEQASDLSTQFGSWSTA